MYPDLSYFFHDVFGTPPDNWTSVFKTFGLFLVLAILASAYLLYKELERKAQAGLFVPQQVQVEENKPVTSLELLSNVVFGFVLGFKLLYIANNFVEFQLNPAAVVFSGYGSWAGGIAGALLFAGFRWWESWRQRHKPHHIYLKDTYPHHLIGDITIIAAVAGVAGAKLFDVLEHWSEFLKNPVAVLLSGSGLAIYGGLILGFVAVAFYLWRKQIPIIHVMDAAAPALIIGYGIGRLGCQFSGDGDWGIVAAVQPEWWWLPDWLWGYDYPHHVLNTSRTDPVLSIPIEGCDWAYCMRLSQLVYPTPVYETFLAFVIGGVLWVMRRPLQFIPGILFFIYLIFNGIERFFIEKIRVNIRYSNFGIEYTQAELVSVILIFIGITGAVFLWRKARRAPSD